MVRSSLAAVGLGTLALVAAATTATPALGGTPTTAVSFRNSRPVLPDEVFKAQLQAAKGLACQPAFPPGIKLPPGLPPHV